MLSSSQDAWLCCGLGHATSCLPLPMCQPQKSLEHLWCGGDPGVCRFSTDKEMPHTGLSPSSLSLTFTTPVMAFSSPSHSSLPVSQPSFCDPSIRKQEGCLILQLGCRLPQKLCTSFLLLHARMKGYCRECSQSCSSDLLCCKMCLISGF